MEDKQTIWTEWIMTDETKDGHDFWRGLYLDRGGQNNKKITKARYKYLRLW